MTALGAEVLVEKIPESGRKCKVAWGKEYIDATGHRRGKREATTLSCYRTMKCKACDATPSDDHVFARC